MTHRRKGRPPEEGVGHGVPDKPNHSPVHASPVAWFAPTRRQVLGSLAAAIGATSALGLFIKLSKTLRSPLPPSPGVTPNIVPFKSETIILHGNSFEIRAEDGIRQRLIADLQKALEYLEKLGIPYQAPDQKTPLIIESDLRLQNDIKGITVYDHKPTITGTGDETVGIDHQNFFPLERPGKPIAIRFNILKTDDDTDLTLAHELAHVGLGDAANVLWTEGIPHAVQLLCAEEKAREKGCPLSRIPGIEKFREVTKLNLDRYPWNAWGTLAWSEFGDKPDLRNAGITAGVVWYRFFRQDFGRIRQLFDLHKKAIGHPQTKIMTERGLKNLMAAINGFQDWYQKESLFQIPRRGERMQETFVEKNEEGNGTRVLIFRGRWEERRHIKHNILIAFLELKSELPTRFRITKRSGPKLIVEERDPLQAQDMKKICFADIKLKGDVESLEYYDQKTGKWVNVFIKKR